MYLESVLFRFRSLKEMGERTLAQLDDDQLVRRSHPEANSIAVLVMHVAGNMRSRWSDFLTSDGEKEWRDRDGEFTEPERASKEELQRIWEEGWRCVFDAVEPMAPADLSRNVLIRGQTLSALDAINRQLSHYSYHLGQIVFLAKELLGDDWKTLSIPRGQSGDYRPEKRD